ncbi:TatD family hydrolase [Sphingomonas sp. LR61]
MTDAHLRSRGDGDGSKRDLTYPPLPEALVVPVYDNHTHMEIADGGDGALDYREHLGRASSVGVRGVVQVGTDLATSQWSASIAAREPRVLAAVALHPNEAPSLQEQGLLDEHLAGIEALAALPRVRAIGETGLDFFRTGEDGRDAQIRSFEEHIRIAKERRPRADHPRPRRARCRGRGARPRRGSGAHGVPLLLRRTRPGSALCRARLVHVVRRNRDVQERGTAPRGPSSRRGT